MAEEKTSYWDEFKKVLASANIPWGYSEVMNDGSALRDAIGWVLWLIPFLFGLHLFYRWLKDGWGFRKSYAVVLVSLPLILFSVLAAQSVQSRTQVTFMYLFPGLRLTDPAKRTYTWQFEGTQPLINVDRIIQNDNESIHFHDQEIDPRTLRMAQWFTFASSMASHETLNLTFQSRDLDFEQELQLVQPQPFVFPAYYSKITETRPKEGRVLLECISDSRYVTYDNTKAQLPICCTSMTPQEGIYVSCAPWYVRMARSIIPSCLRK
jgi:hypothetical protein